MYPCCSLRLVQSGCERVAQDGVEHLESVVVGRPALHAQPPDHHGGLGRTGLIYDHHVSASHLGRFGKSRRREWLGGIAPIGEGRIQLVGGFFRGDIAYHNHGGPTGLINSLMESLEVGLLEACDSGVRSGHAFSVSMGFRIEKTRKKIAGHRASAVAVLTQRSPKFLLHSFDIVRAKIRTQHHVGAHSE